MGVKLLLHAGCGSKLNKAPRVFAAYREVRLDCNKMVEPDIIGSIVAMPQIDSDSFDAVFCSHVMEHLYAHEVAMAFAEFARILKPGGEILVQCPDLQAIGGKIALDQLDVCLYQSGMGMVTPLDMLYGHRGAIGAGNLFMGHKTGFTQSVLKGYMDVAGFVSVVMDRETMFELKASARKPEEVTPFLQNHKPKEAISQPTLASTG
jgi:SAM-dependent methyltransferase